MLCVKSSLWNRRLVFKSCQSPLLALISKWSSVSWCGTSVKSSFHTPSTVSLRRGKEACKWASCEDLFREAGHDFTTIWCLYFVKKNLKKTEAQIAYQREETARFVGINDHFEAEPLSCLWVSKPHITVGEEKRRDEAKKRSHPLKDK